MDFFSTTRYELKKVITLFYIPSILYITIWFLSSTHQLIFLGILLGNTVKTYKIIRRVDIDNSRACGSSALL